MKNAFILLAALMLFSCSNGEEDEPTVEISDCMQTQISDFETDWATCEGSFIKKYDFQNAEVFAFQIGNCLGDAQLEIYNADCTSKCNVGGLLGETDCDGVHFFDNAIELEIVWEQ